MAFKSVFFLALAFNLHHAAYLCFSFGLQRKLHRSGSHLRHKIQPLSSTNVNVYDNIFDADACLLLHDLAVDHCNRCEAGSIFVRTPDTIDGLNPLEKAVDSILNELNDTSPIVEYWSRSCYINIDAHADIDENTLKQDGILRCPKNAHVLYMQVANSGNKVGTSDDERSKRMGPTVVFPQRKVAWGSTTQIPSITGGEEYVVDVENDWDEDVDSNQQYNKEDSKEDDMVIVPAKTGRLLRFDGRAFHAVPKPPHRYVMSKKELNSYLQEEEADCGEDEYWDDEYELEQEETDLTNLRSVLLFNTWPAGSSGPRGVLPDTFDVDEDDMPGGIELYSSSYYEYQSQMEKERLENWRKEYGDDFEQLHCNGVDDWKQVALKQMISRPDFEGNVVVPLMGNPSRRGCDIMQDVLRGPSKRMNDMFYDSEQVSLVELMQNE
jgi:hypothetical protein